LVGLPVSWRLPTWFLTAVKLEPRESKTEEKSMKVSDETQAEALAANLQEAHGPPCVPATRAPSWDQFRDVVELSSSSSAFWIWLVL